MLLVEPVQQSDQPEDEPAAVDAACDGGEAGRQAAQGSPGGEGRMMSFSGDQLAIEFPAASHARRSDPATSREAARRVREFAAGQCAAILAVLRERGPLGAEQVAAYLRIDAYAVRKRLADLEHAGLARPLALHRVTASGRHERIWEWY